MKPVFLLLILLTVPPSWAADTPPAVVLFFGDSITAGYGLSNADEAFPALIQARVDSLGWGATIINAGLSGEPSSGG